MRGGCLHEKRSRDMRGCRPPGESEFQECLMNVAASTVQPHKMRADDSFCALLLVKSGAAANLSST